jgi:hypothetical protein
MSRQHVGSLFRLRVAVWEGIEPHRRCDGYAAILPQGGSTVPSAARKLLLRLDCGL